MRTFARKQKPTQQAKTAGSTSHGRAYFPQSQAVRSIFHLQRTLQANAKELQAGSTMSAPMRFAHDFIRIPIFSTSPIQDQPQLMVSMPGDMCEQETDRVADQVMRMPAPLLQRACPCAGHPRWREEQSNQKHPQAELIHRGVFRRVEVASRIHESISSLGQPLDEDTRSFFEPRFGCDFTKVRVHTNKTAAESADVLNASAYTLGQDIIFGSRQYRPNTNDGKRLLAHELTHVVQQTPLPGRPQSGILATSLSRVPGHLIQRRLIAQGEAQDFAALVNQIIGSSYQVEVSPQGEVSLRTLRPSESPPGSELVAPIFTPGAQELVDVLREVIEQGSTIIRFIRGRSSGDQGVWFGASRVGGRDVHTIDLDDMEESGFQWELGERSGGTAEAFLAHEILEAYHYEISGEVDPERRYAEAHRWGLEAEARAAGAYRSASDSHSVPWQRRGQVRSLQVFAYRYPNGEIVDVIMHILNGNIVEVRRATRPYQNIQLGTFDYQYPGSGVQTFRPVVDNGQPRFDRVR